MNNKYVVLIGVLDKTGSTNISQASSFARFGFNVIPINYRTIITEYGMEYFEDLLIYTVKKYNPVLTLFSKCNGINPDIVKECSKYTTTWLYNMDPISTIKRCPEVIEHAKNAHFSSCTGRGITDWFIEQGVENCYHIFCGLDYKVFRPVESVDELKAYISFIGTRTLERDDARTFFVQRGFNTKFYGKGYSDKEMINEDFAKVCSSSKIMLSLNNENQPLYFSNRLLRYMGCGSCVVHYDPTKTLGNIFEDGKEIILFSDFDELEHKMMGLTLEKMGQIALAGREKVLKNFTWDHTITNILLTTGYNFG